MWFFVVLIVGFVLDSADKITLPVAIVLGCLFVACGIASLRFGGEED